jgi:hypothetical protein
MSRKADTKGIEYSRYSLTKAEFEALTKAQQSDIRQAEHRRRWRKNNKAKVAQYHKNWRALNKAKVAGYHKRYQANNPEKVKAWREAHNAKVKEELAAAKAILEPAAVTA